MIADDDGELDALIHDLDVGTVRRKLMPQVERVTKRGANNIKGDWKKIWQGHPHIKDLPRSVSYDVESGPDLVEAVVGPEHGRSSQATLAHLIEYGDAEYGNVRNAPIPGGLPSLMAEEPRYVRALADLGEEALGNDVG